MRGKRLEEPVGLAGERGFGFHGERIVQCGSVGEQDLEAVDGVDVLREAVNLLVRAFPGDMGVQRGLEHIAEECGVEHPEACEFRFVQVLRTSGLDFTEADGIAVGGGILGVKPEVSVDRLVIRGCKIFVAADP